MKLTVKGYTLVELIVAMTVFMVVLMIASTSFDTILKHSSRLTRTEESNIEGVIGLEMLRHDLAQAGFGMFTEYDSTMPIPNYPEAASPLAAALNISATGGGVPRPIAARNNLVVTADSSFSTVADSDYLAVRATSASTNRNAQRWTFVQYSTTGKPPKKWPSAAENIEDGTKVVMVRRIFSSTGYVNRLVVDSSGNYSVSFDGNSAFTGVFRPVDPSDFIYVFGLTDSSPRMPFNRTDYFVAKGNVPQVCANNTGVLYKTVVNHSNGQLEYIPVLDCVANMQVVFGWDINQDGKVDTYSNADGSSVNGTGSVADVQATLGDAALLRQRLSMVKVYILTQVGKYDGGYTATSPIRVGDDDEGSLTKDYILTGNMFNYRWKLYKIVVRPKNIVSIQ